MNKSIIYIASIFIISLLSVTSSFSQVSLYIDKNDFKTDDKKGLKAAMEQIMEGDYYFDLHEIGGYTMALDYYLKADAYNSENPALNYKIGVCYIYTSEKKKAISYLEKAYQLDSEVSFDIKYVLGRAYQVSCKYEEAIDLYQGFKLTDY